MSFFSRIPVALVPLGVRTRASHAGGGANALAKVLESFIPGMAPTSSRGRVMPMGVAGLPSLLQGFDEMGPRMFPASAFTLTSAPDEKSYNVSLAVPGVKPTEISVRVVDKRRLEVDVKSEEVEPQSVKSIRAVYAMELPDDAEFDVVKANARLTHGELKLDIGRRERNVVEVPVTDKLE